VTISSGSLLPTAWSWSGIFSSSPRVIELTRELGRERCEYLGHGLLGIQFISNRCGVNTSLICPIVQASNTENLLFNGVWGVTIDWPENPLQPFLTLWHVQPCWPCWPFGDTSLTSISAMTAWAMRLFDILFWPHSVDQILASKVADRQMRGGALSLQL